MPTPGPYQSYMTGANNQALMRWCPAVKYSAPSDPPFCYEFIRPTENGVPVPGSYSLTHVSRPSQALVVLDAVGLGQQYIGGGPSGHTFDNSVKPICFKTQGQSVRHGGVVQGLYADFRVETLQWATQIDFASPERKQSQAKWTQIGQ